MTISWVVTGTVGIALLFDYINGFHDSANSIATVVATRVLRPLHAVVRSARLAAVNAILHSAWPN